MSRRILTGIKPTGSPHLGNLAGAIAPAIQMAHDAADAQCFFFLADFHALTGGTAPDELHAATHEIAATWLAFGLDPKRAFFYRQSDIPEVFELSWMLTCVCPKGMMNRSHAYKAAKADQADKKGADDNINMGLFTYPLLMAADILLFQATDVPVGKDQVQHIEVARDLAQRVNLHVGSNLALPKAVVAESGVLLPGSDGRKMSKSYGNTIPIWVEPKRLSKLIAAIPTDSSAKNAPKPKNHALHVLATAFCGTDTQSVDALFDSGASWHEIKIFACDAICAQLLEPRRKYQELAQDSALLERTLMLRVPELRETAANLIAELRSKVGIRRLS
jgi:tryptophanyl-tRNA synthetase